MVKATGNPPCEVYDALQKRPARDDHPTSKLEGAYKGLQLNQPRRAAACKGRKQFAGTGKLVLWQACFHADTPVPSP